MSLVIEDGSIVAGANSYVTVAEIRDYATARGVTLPADNSDVEILAIKAMDYLESQRRYKGEKVDIDQTLQWPRAGAYVDGFRIPDDSIPRELRFAQMAAAIEAKGADLLPNKDGKGAVSSETVGPISVSYATSTGSAPTGPSAFSKAWVLLRPLLRVGGMMAVRS